MKTKPVVTTDTSLCRLDNHLADFETCRGCQKSMPWTVWEKQITHLIAKEVYGKHGSLVLVLECPKCFEKNWVHISYLSPLSAPDRLVKAFTKEIAARKLRAVRDWGKALCWNCKNLTEASITTNPWRECKIGSGPARTECDRYDPIT